MLDDKWVICVYLDGKGKNFHYINSSEEFLQLVQKDDVVIKAAANIPGVKTTMVSQMNVYEIVNHTSFIITADAVKKIEEVYA